MAYSPGRGKSPVRLRGLAADDDLEPENLVREVQRALELGDDRGLRRELCHNVVPLGLSIDLEREPPAAPAVDLSDRAAGLGDDPGDAIQCRGHDGFVGLRGQDEHGLVLPQLPTSSGLDGPPGGAGMGRSRVYRFCVVATLAGSTDT